MTRPDTPDCTRSRALKRSPGIDRLKEMHMHVHSGSGASTSKVLRISLCVTLAYIALLVFAGIRAHSLALLS
jgi:Co/Zn/Cd efflux system component